MTRYKKDRGNKVTKKPLIERGCGVAIPLILQNTKICFTGIGTLFATLQTGCRASQGRFPPPLWMRAVITAILSSLMCSVLCSVVFVDYFALVGSIPNEQKVVKGRDIIVECTKYT
jgi:hypothetical protein